MAFGKTLAHRFFNAAKSSSTGTLLPPCLRAAEPSSYLRRLLPDSSEERGLLRRFLQWRALFQSAERLPLPVGDALADRIRQLNRERLRLEGLVPPPRSPPEAKLEEEERISVEEERKMLRAAQMEAERERLRAIQRSCVAYAEFAQIFCDVAGVDQGLGVARALDESGAVIVHGDVAFLRRFTNLSQTPARSGVSSATSDSTGAPVASAGAPAISAASFAGAHAASFGTHARHFHRFPCSNRLFRNRREDPDLACSSRPVDLPRPADLQHRGIRLPPLWPISTVLIFLATVAGSPFPAQRRSFLAEDSASFYSPFKTLALGFLVKALSLAMEGLEMEGEMPYLLEDEAVGEDLAAGEDLVAGVLARFHSSTRNDHQHLCAAVRTMVQALKDQGIPLNPIVYLGATASSLDRLSRDPASGSNPVIIVLLSFLILFAATEALKSLIGYCLDESLV